jgi:SAM-dependent methyltransferase
MANDEIKEAVRQHWEETPCGTRDLAGADRARFFRELEDTRYQLEPYIRTFARFHEGKGKKVLEVGVGAGTDFVNWVRAGADATGIDLTSEGVSLTRERLALEGLHATVLQGDAERLPFPDNSFDLVYSYGVVHHSPDTARAVSEIHRVLRPGGRARVMIYHLHSWVTLMVWGMNGLLRGRPWMSPRAAVANHLESPGTKVYSLDEARALFSQFTHVVARPQLSHGDLLLMQPSQRYRSPFTRLLFRAWPRRLIRATGDRFGTALLVDATKPG